MQHLLAAAAVATAACQLDPLVSDMPGASANILPSNATIKTADQNPNLLTQLILNDHLDTTALAMNANIIKRGSGQSSGSQVMYWAFGQTDVAPAPIYIFGTGAPTSPAFQKNDHLPLVEAVPGDSGYNPLHAIYNVAVTDRYHGEKITTTGALADAIAIGLVAKPVATRVFVNFPIVRPGLRLEVGGSNGTVASSRLYGDGYIVDGFQLGGKYSMQPNPVGLLPTSQVSFLREPQQGAYDATRPIFQATIPTSPPQMVANYTPVSIVVNVDVAMGAAATITSDSQLFTRSATGAITGSNAGVLQFTVTTTALDLQLQFEDGVQ